MEKEQRLFRKAAFGGFNKEDVISYIEKMKQEFAQYKQQVEETMDALNAQISDFQNAPPMLAEEADIAPREDAAVDSISAATEHLKEVGDALCLNLNALIDKLQSAPAAPSGEDQLYALLQSLLDAQVTEAPTQPAGDDQADDLLQNLFAAQDTKAPAEPAGDAQVLSIMQGLFSTQDTPAPKPEKEQFSKDAALVESVLPEYLR